MSLWTVRLRALSHDGRRAPHVLSHRDGFEVLGIAAQTIAAEMIDVQPSWG